MATRQKKSRPVDNSTDEAGGSSVDLIEDIDDELDDSDTPERPTVSIDLPATIHVTPEHELAVSIADIPVNPGSVGSSDTGTLSVTVGAHSDMPPDVAIDGEAEDAADSVYSRRDRLRGQVDHVNGST